MHLGAAIQPIGKSSRSARRPGIGVISDTAWRCCPWHARDLDPGRAPGGEWGCPGFWGQGALGMAVVSPLGAVLYLGGMLCCLASKMKWADHVPSRKTNMRLTGPPQPLYRVTCRSPMFQGRMDNPEQNKGQKLPRWSRPETWHFPQKNKCPFSGCVSAITE